MKTIATSLLGFFAFFILSVGVASAAPLPTSFADLAEQLTPAVVNISTRQTIIAQKRNVPQLPPPFGDLFEDYFKQSPNGAPPKKRQVSSLGSGFIIDPDGIIITNNHVIEKADEISVKLSDGREYPARIIGRDPKTDIAVLKVEAKKDLPFVPLGDSNKVRVGDWAIAIGNPFGLGGSLSAGVISAINRNINAGPYDSFIQTDAAINRGNSGGPLFNMKGEVIGVNSAIISPSGGSVGIGFSIPADIVKTVVSQLREYGETRRGWLGVRIQILTKELSENLGLDDTGGALVSEVSPEGPAAKGGIKRGDVIIRFDGQTIEEMRDLPRIVANTKIDKAVSVQVIRNGKRRTLRIVTGRLAEDIPDNTQTSSTEDTNDNNAEVLGLRLRTLDDATRQELSIEKGLVGVLIVNVDPDSAAGASGFRRGDVILEIASSRTSKVADVKRTLNAAQKDGAKSVLVLLSSRNGTRFVALRLDKN